MTRTHVAAVLGVVALSSVLATAAVATRDRSEPEPTLTVRGTGGTFEVPAEGWKVTDSSVRIFYADEKGRPVAVVHGPAVYRAGYCGKGSNQAFAGFTDQGLGAWVGALGEPHASGADHVTLGDGAEARLEWARVAQPTGDRCAAAEVYVAMVRTADARVVLVADAGDEPGTLDDAAVGSILRSLTRLP